jgi:D-3-phosphoglycerate dehydrogenase
VRILVAEPLAEDGLTLLRAEHEVVTAANPPREELLERIPRYDALIVRSGIRVDAQLIRAGTRLVVIGRAGTGLDNIDLEAADAAGVAVVNAPAANTTAVAEHALALMLALARQITTAESSLRAGEWRRADFMGVELAGKTLGIIGLGRIGLAVADRARAMDMQLLGADPYVAADAAAAHGVRLAPIAELLPRADFVSLHVPLADATRGLLGPAELAQMKPTAIVINTARGGIVDETALAAALAAGRLGGAGMDVFEDEPLPADSPLRSAPNTVLTPHLGASTREAQTRAGVETAQRVLDVLALYPSRQVTAR